ncbi:protein canopy homolog 2 [Callorhinchus milii]|uniref:Canopy 2-like n=1 Tax=Callorhinchus milii TaxID=7868 RepID=V9KIE8_CALMI|nr:protein canopy homolog 2 [Callorhinchus milii]XP_042200120.1 protein canopy homolog 2 [Callorhinchus milii]|eukprot:gi/632986288/ref/XP_007910154.1/ PREDICTED: protein canopy homolog 2 [Callorhinchus milii]
MKSCNLSVICFLLVGSVGIVESKKTGDLFCGACRALVDEIEWEILQIDPKKVIQTESFHLNPEGTQAVAETPYARSEVFLIELLERVCEHMVEYGEIADPKTHRNSYIRVRTHNSKNLDLPNTQADAELTSSLKHACEKIAEEYEDEFIEFFTRESSNVKDQLCSKRTDLCDHALYIPHDEL